MNPALDTGDSPRVLIVEDDEALRRLVRAELQDAGYAVEVSGDAESAWDYIAHQRPDLVISDLRLPRADGLALLRQGRQLPAPPGFIMITAFGTVDQAVEALKEGADDFLVKPFDLNHLMLSVRRVGETRRLRDEISRFRRLLGAGDFHGMIGRSPAMQWLFDTIRKVARAAGPVLVTGESGVGKELVARALHRESPRAAGPLVAVNCAGIPADLLESELFGHVAGAFTGAQRARQGLFAQADGGTLLLDEIGELPLAMQAKLLRTLEDQGVRPVGADRERPVDVRVVAATNRDLEQEVAGGGFREDLFYRLNTFTLRVPPLRERDEDLQLLTAYFINRFSTQLDHAVEGLTNEALECLRSYAFPGNVRELANVIERAVTFCPDSRIGSVHLPEHLRSCDGNNVSAALLDSIAPGPELPTLQEVEQRYIAHVMERLNSNKRRAAQVLGIGRRTLYRRLGNDETQDDPL